MIKITIVMLPMIPTLETVHTYCTATPNQDLLLTCNLRTWGLQNESILATIRPTSTCCDVTPKHRKTVLLEGVGVFLRNSEKGTMQSTSNVEIIDYIVVVVGGGGPPWPRIGCENGTSTWDFPEIYNKLLSNLHFQKERQQMCVSCFWFFQTSRENQVIDAQAKSRMRHNWALQSPTIFEAWRGTGWFVAWRRFEKDGLHWSSHEHYISYS